MIWAFGAKAPIARPTNSTAPTPSENPTDIDLADQIAEADGKERRKNRLGPDDFAGKLEHGMISWQRGNNEFAQSAG